MMYSHPDIHTFMYVYIGALGRSWAGGTCVWQNFCLTQPFHVSFFTCQQIMFFRSLRIS